MEYLGSKKKYWHVTTQVLDMYWFFHDFSKNIWEANIFRKIVACNYASTRHVLIF